MSMRNFNSAEYETARDAGQSTNRARRRWVVWVLPIVGLASLLWFLLRVIPKPSRAAYPCQRVAFPLASSFVLWVTGVFGSALAFGKARLLLRRSRLAMAALCILVGAAATWLAVTNMREQAALAEDNAPFVPADPPLSPMGVGKGINPGRVVWVRDPDATSWNGSGRWWYDTYSDQAVIDAMMSDAIRWLTGCDTDADAWEALFRDHNGGPAYTPGEKIAIKVNLVNVGDQTGNTNRNMASPQLVLALAKQLIYNAGVAPGDIVVYDSSRYIPDCLYDRLAPLGVVCAQRVAGAGRIGSEYDPARPIYFSHDQINEPMELSFGIYNGPFHPATYHTAATYFINLANLKGHYLVGGTLCAKNLFGSTWNFDVDAWDKGWGPGAFGGLHQYVRTAKTNTAYPNYPVRPYGTYNSLVDLMGHEEFGGKGLLYILDGIYAATAHNATPTRWESLSESPDWASSILISQDPVAIESVGQDLLRNEPTVATCIGDVDNYLHEAALADDPPSGTFYDPNHDGQVERLSSLGVHEHWNSAAERLYSRNLGMGFGVELLRAAPSPVARRQVFYNNSAYDGADPLPNADDDNAIAPDTMALLVGGWPGPVNCTNYSRGINGVMLDVAGLAAPEAISASDFTFLMSATGEFSGWTAAPAPLSVTVRQGEGIGGRDRVTVIWADGTIADRWLSVSLKATPNTGLPADDVFCVGNLSGDWTGDLVVNTADYTTWADTFGNDGSPGKEDMRADGNRDGVVDTVDYVIWADHFGGTLAAPSP